MDGSLSDHKEIPEGSQEAPGRIWEGSRIDPGNFIQDSFIHAFRATFIEHVVTLSLITGRNPIRELLRTVPRRA